VVRVDAASLRPALERWSTASPPRAVHVTLDGGGAPAAYARQWLIALRRDGTAVHWGTVSPMLASAIAAEPIADPRGGTRVRVAAPAGAAVVVRDALGPLDSLRVMPGGQGITLTMPATVPTLDAVVGGTPARAAVVDSLTLRRLLVLGRASWESKFLIRSLEEQGWLVDVRLAVAPKAAVTEGQSGAIDTARYAAVIAVDSSVAPTASRIAAYVRSGGGLLVLGTAARPFHLASGTRLRDADGPPVDRRSLGLFPISALPSDAVVLERRDRVVAVAARRMGLGRVVQIGYDDTWRWRMAGGDSAAAQHRAWWAALVSGVAYAPRTERALPADADAAPLAHLIDALGPPMPAVQPDREPFDPTRSLWAFAALLAPFLLEWGSRRLRGQR
jgi:hypothetical protein